jgi:hypothetical protein
MTRPITAAAHALLRLGRTRLEAMPDHGDRKIKDLRSALRTVERLAEREHHPDELGDVDIGVITPEAIEELDAWLKTVPIKYGV